MDILNSLQRKILQILPDVQDSDQFYLTGGTALAQFYLTHRRSNDLDFFTPTIDIILPFSFNLEKYLNEQKLVVKRQRGLHSFVELQVALNNETTLIHIAQDAAFRFEATKEFTECPRLKVDNLTDIASNKLLALFGRANLRDFIDVYFLIWKKGFTKKELTQLALRKDPGFDAYWLGVAFERIRQFDQNSVDMLLLLKPLDFTQIRNFFDEWRREIAEELKS